MPHRFSPRIEQLEARTVPTLFTVTTTAVNFASDGQVSILEAIQAANTNLPSGDAPAGTDGLDTIQFHPGLNGQTMTNTNAGGLAITDDLTINGPGAGLLALSGNNTLRIFTVGALAEVVINGLTLTQGRSVGGAIYNGGTLALNDVVLTANTSGTSGGAIYNDGNLTLTGCTLAGNSADIFGGGIYNGLQLTVINSTFLGNSSQNGGGLMNVNVATVSGSTFMGNSSSNGGGIYNSSNLTVVSSTFAGNTSSGDGGGIANWWIAGVRNSTFSGNTAAASGGGIANEGGHLLFANNCTLAGNLATNGGGIYNAGAASVAGTLVAGNSATTAGHDLYGPFELGFSLVQRMGSFALTGSALSTNLLGVDPRIGPLADNGGQVLTHALLPGSPALDRGSNPLVFTTDGRSSGMLRVIGPAADIGAFESHDSDVRLVPDPKDRSKNVLVVVGTRKSDSIGFRTDDGDIEVNLNGEFFAFDPQSVHRLSAFGLEGHDTIKSSLPIPALFDGGRGADTLTGGSATDILLGGNGADILLGGGGRDILIGGNGADRATGGGGDDLLIGGRTIYDQDQISLDLILAGWNSSQSYTERRDNLASGTGTPQLGAIQITDGFADKLTGDTGLEIFFSGPGDELVGKVAAEKKVIVA